MVRKTLFIVCNTKQAARWFYIMIIIPLGNTISVNSMNLEGFRACILTSSQDVLNLAPKPNKLHPVSFVSEDPQGSRNSLWLGKSMLRVKYVLSMVFVRSDLAKRGKKC